MNCLNVARAASKSMLTSWKIICLSSINCKQSNLFNAVRKYHKRKVNLSDVDQWSNAVKKRTIRNYALAVTLFALGLTYAAVPMYGIFCQATGYGGTTRHENDETVLRNLKKNANRKIVVKFNSDVAANMAWNFRPQQEEIEVSPGETALAFYTANNPTDKPIIGVSTYNVVPFEAGPYFNKIQCFCFEEQILNPHEQVDMPVFFYIDPEYAEDPELEFVNEVILSYTFFEAKEHLKIPIPGFLKKN